MLNRHTKASARAALQGLGFQVRFTLMVRSSESPESFIGLELRGTMHADASSRQQAPVLVKLLRHIGSGKFAWVFEATLNDGKAYHSVAVKLLYRHDEQAARRFLREIKVLQQLPPHPNRVAYRGHGQHQRYAWFAMDFIDGPTLSRIIRHRGALPERTACNLMADLCAGFEGLHRLGLTHRDITPDNIMVTRQEQAVKLMDFGLVQDSQGLLQLYEHADILSGKDFLDDLDSGLIAGTPEYMAPEQISDPSERDPARQRTDTTADVFALGTIFYEMLSGHRLFPYEKGSAGAPGRQGLINYLNYRSQLRDDSIQRPSEISSELWTIVRKALSWEPKLRQRTAAEFGSDLRYYLETGQGILEDDLSVTIAADMSYPPLSSDSTLLDPIDSLDTLHDPDFAALAKQNAAKGKPLPQRRQQAYLGAPAEGPTRLEQDERSLLQRQVVRKEARPPIQAQKSNHTLTIVFAFAAIAVIGALLAVFL